jgi:D-sedoheptulose 7-phosphate isomerase
MAGLKRKTLAHLRDLFARYPRLEGTRRGLARAASLICACRRKKKKILLCGNGGSAADCLHIAGELMKSFALPRRPPEADLRRLRNSQEGWEFLVAHLQQGVPALALSTNVPLLTAIANDISPELIFAQQVYVLGQPGDVLIGLSTSGKSASVIAALKTARAGGMATIGFTGGAPAPMDHYCDVLLKTSARETFKVQEEHLPLYHTLCLMVEEELFG